MEDVDQVAPRLTGEREGTFVYETICHRWPSIIVNVIDYLARSKDEFDAKYGKDSAEGIKAITNELSEMRYKIMTDKPMEPLRDMFTDVAMWNALINEKIMNNDKENVTWFKQDWLFAECYLYRKMFGAVLRTTCLQNIDVFAEKKEESFQTNKDQIIEAVNAITTMISEDFQELNATRCLTEVLENCLWGNRSDLSLSGGIVSLFEKAPVDLKERENLIIVNHIKSTVDVMLHLEKKNGTRRVDLVLDNSGVELIGDLILADYLISSNLADKIVFHGKKIPWFVSDVTERDWKYAIDTLNELTDNCKDFAQRINKRMEEGIYTLSTDLFWTSPFDYNLLPERAPELYKDMSESSLIVFKGDLNYRKLVQDREWPYETPFEVALGQFKLRPAVVLRTLKAETVCGLSDDTIDYLTSKYGSSNKWMVTGKYAVVQLAL